METDAYASDFPCVRICVTGSSRGFPLVQNCSFEFELGSSTELIGGCLKCRLERHRARRYPFHASIELTDLESETQAKAQTSDLSPAYILDWLMERVAAAASASIEVACR